MYNPDTELLFPSRVIPELRDLRGKAWAQLVDNVVGKELTSLEHLAFVLMMAKLDGCTTCHADSFRAMGGCTQCAVQNVRRFRGEDDELIEMYDNARAELSRKFEKQSGKK